MNRPHLSIRQLTGGLMLLLLIGLGAIVRLIAAGRAMSRANHALQRDGETLPAVDGLSLDLLSLSRLTDLQRTGDRDADDLAVSPSQPQQDLEPLRQKVERDARRDLDGLRAFVDTPEEQRVHDDMRANVSAYLAQVDRLAGRAPQDIGPSLDAALGAVAAFRAYNIAQIQSASAAATSLTAQAYRWSLIAIGVMIAVGLSLGAGLRWGVERPVRRLTKALALLGQGDLKARAEVSGPEELQQIAAAFNDMGERLEGAQRNRLHFLSAVAHDLRNPLWALKLTAHNLERLQETPGGAAPATWQLVARQVERLDRLVGDLLDTTRIESGSFELDRREADLRELATASVALFHDSSPLHTLELELPPDPLVADCDPARIEQVLNNLLSNAIKYSPDGGLIRVRLVREAERARLSVSDHGIGIAPEERKLLFEPFRRAPSGQEVAPGVGLGLSVARRIVLAHGGTLELDSLPGVGTTFHVELPLARPRTDAKGTAAGGEETPSAVRVLPRA